MNKKNKKLTFPSDEIVPYELKRHFIRGYLDGDGSVYTTKSSTQKTEISVTFVGTKDFLDGLKDYWSKDSLKLDKRYKEREYNIYQLRIGGNMKVIEILYRLYKDSTTCMERKYNVFKKFIEEYFK